MVGLLALASSQAELVSLSRRLYLSSPTLRASNSAERLCSVAARAGWQCRRWRCEPPWALPLVLEAGGDPKRFGRTGRGAAAGAAEPRSAASAWLGRHDKLGIVWPGQVRAQRREFLQLGVPQADALNPYLFHEAVAASNESPTSSSGPARPARSALVLRQKTARQSEQEPSLPALYKKALHWSAFCLQCQAGRSWVTAS